MLLLYPFRRTYFADVTSKFTFHYASTLSWAENPRSLAHPLFTFHYASTLSDTHTKQRGVYIIYIPLCFYFIYHWWARRTCRSKFTFHYASTLSAFASSWLGHLSWFTFHYASTLSHGFVKLVLFVLHLHSTMLLLYPFGFVVCFV